MVNIILLFYRKNRLLVNSTFSVVQVLAIGLSYFLLYTLVLRKLGPVKLGTWSLILSTSSVANIASLGISSSLVKYVASYSKAVDAEKINNLIRTGLIAIAMLMSAICVFLLAAGYYLLPLVLPQEELQEGLLLLPFSLFSLFLNGINGIFLSTIDGLHYSSFRSIIYTISSVFFLVFGYFLLNDYGLIGIAVAQVAQAGIILLISGTGLKLLFKKFHLWPLRWDSPTFKLIVNYSLNFQAIGIAQLFYDPTTKFLLSKYGNLSFVGFYEIASRLVVQIRSLIVSANQIIVPAISQRIKKNTSVSDPLYKKVYDIVFLLTIPTAVLLFLSSSSISFYWFGYYENYFIYSFVFLTVGYFINLLSVPAYFSGMGIGNLKGNLVSQLTIAIINAVAGFVLGYFFGGWGVVIAWTFAIAVGGIITVIYYHSEYSIPYKLLIDEDKLTVLATSLFCIAISVIINFNYENYFSQPSIVLINSVFFVIYLFFSFRQNPLFLQLLSKLIRNKK